MSNEDNSNNMFKKALTDFCDAIDCLRTVFDSLNGIIHTFNSGMRKQMSEFVNSCNHSEREGTVSLSLNSDEYLKFKRLDRRHRRTSIASDMMPRSCIINLVSRFDKLIGDLARAIYEAKPVILDGSEKTLKFSDLIRIGSIEKARAYIVENEVEILLRMSHAEQVKKLCSFLKNAVNYPNIWSDFIEICERRNLFVHSDSIVSDQYINVCLAEGFKVPQDCKKGTRLDVDRHYFIKACDVLLEFGVKLGTLIWKTMYSDADYIGFINNLSVDLISQRQYNLAIELLEYPFSFSKKPNGTNELLLKINKAQSLKWKGDENSAKAILDGIDWGPLADNYKLVNHVLRDEFEQAISLMRKLGAMGMVGDIQYRDWPIFKKLREYEKFPAVYNEIFGKPYTSVELDKNEASLFFE